MASRVIGRLPVVYNPQSHRIEVENTAEFVETQISNVWMIWPTGSRCA